MNTLLLRDWLLACTAVNYGVLILWFAAFCFLHDALYRLHHRWFRLSEEKFDALHYQGMAIYKIGILLLNLVPYLTLRYILPA